MITRRKFLASAGALAGSAAVLQNLSSAEGVKTREPNKPRETSAAANKNLPLIDRVDPKSTLPPGEPGKGLAHVLHTKPAQQAAPPDVDSDNQQLRTHRRQLQVIDPHHPATVRVDDLLVQHIPLQAQVLFRWREKLQIALG